jgi:hypothetical protein
MSKLTHEPIDDYPPMTETELEGYMAAKHGLPETSNPYIEGRDSHHDWAQGWWSCPTAKRCNTEEKEQTHD